MLYKVVCFLGDLSYLSPLICGGPSKCSLYKTIVMHSKRFCYKLLLWSIRKTYDQKSCLWLIMVIEWLNVGKQFPRLHKN